MAQSTLEPLHEDDNGCSDGKLAEVEGGIYLALDKQRESLSVSSPHPIKRGEECGKHEAQEVKEELRKKQQHVEQVVQGEEPEGGREDGVVNEDDEDKDYHLPSVEDEAYEFGSGGALLLLKARRRRRMLTISLPSKVFL